MISGLVTGVLLLAFLGIAAWAWSARAQPRFQDAAQLPLRDEPPAPPEAARRVPERAHGCCGQCGGREGPR